VAQRGMYERSHNIECETCASESTFCAITYTLGILWRNTHILIAQKAVEGRES
jgi:hypothetical protein